MTVVVVGSPLYGDTFGIAVRVTNTGAMIDMPYAPPRGTVLSVHFQHITEDDILTEFTMRADVIDLVLNGPRRIVILRYLEIIDDMEIAALRVMH